MNVNLCCRQLVLCRVTLGKSFLQFSAMKMAHSPPGHHSVIGRPSVGGLTFPEYVVYRGEQAYPEYLLNYQIVKPEGSESPKSWNVFLEDVKSTIYCCNNHLNADNFSVSVVAFPWLGKAQHEQQVMMYFCKQEVICVVTILNTQIGTDSK